MEKIDKRKIKYIAGFGGIVILLIIAMGYFIFGLGKTPAEQSSGQSASVHQSVPSGESQQMLVDSVVFQGNGYPYQVKTYARQYVVRESTISEYSFVSSCQLVDAARSDVNPHGLMIEKFRVLENNLKETRKR